MIYVWIFIIVFPLVLLIQLNSQRRIAKKTKGGRFTSKHFLKAIIHALLLTIVAYLAYFISLLVNT